MNTHEGWGIVFSTAPFSATTTIRSAYRAGRRALCPALELAVAEGWTPVMPAVLFSQWLRMLQDLGVILRHLSHFLVTDSERSLQRRLPFLAQIRQLGSGRACTQFRSL